MLRITGVWIMTLAVLVAEEALPAPSAAAPPDVVNSAVAAVRQLGEQVVLGRYQFAIERMNPLWKDRAARRAGGMEALENQLNKVAREMVRQGISIISSEPEGRPRALEVSPGTTTRTVDGQTIEEPVYTRWMVFVPTVTTYRIIMEGEPRPLIVESTGFQVAVSDKDPIDWTFIDGSSVTVNELRSLFISIPADYELPPIGRRQSR